MFVGHAPASYLLAKLLETHLPLRSRTVIWTAVTCGLLPDLDLIYFYGIDQRAHPHHSYWTHTPAFWGALLAPALAVCWRSARARALVIVGAAGLFGHLVLDSPVGGIAWLYPLRDTQYFLFQVPATRSWWVWNFVLHWTFLFEVAVVGAAVLQLRGARGARAGSAEPCARLRENER